YGNTIQDLTTLNGATVVYPEVTVYRLSGAENLGRSVHKFEVETDEIYPAAQGYRDGVILLDNSWKAGEEILQSQVLAGGTHMAKKVANDYVVLQPTNITATKIGRKGLDEGVCGPYFSVLDIYSL